MKKNDNVVETREPEVVVNTVNSKNMEIKVFFCIKDFNKLSATSGDVRAGIYQQLRSKGLNVV